jgi:hypothetical protein
MKDRQLTALMVTLLAIQAFTNFTFMPSSHGQTSPDVYVGIDLSYGDVAEAKAMMDQVSSYTNLIVVGTSKITWYPDKLNETFDYAYEKGLSFISLPPSITTYNSPLVNKTEWYEYAENTWGDRLLGFYYMDEPGGRQLDGVQQLTGNVSSESSYADAANRFTTVLSHRIDSDWRSAYSYKSFTSDYALYWFDYQAGYDTIFAEFGWNYSRQLNVALCRGAATGQNKDWGAMITWTYTAPPYIESGEELYNDLVLAYDNGAKYIVVFDGNEGWTEGILQQEHLDALQRFWDYVQSNPRQSNPVGERTAYVLPDAYGYGFRGPEDHIWGLWAADALTHNITISVASLLNEYGEKLDIIYDDGLQPSNNYGYNQLFYWDSYSLPPPKISILSPENKTYAESNVTLTFTLNKPVTWIGYSLDNQAQVTITENITLTNLPVGLHNITVYAKNELETMGTSETIHFDVSPPDPVEPFPTGLVVAAASVSVAVIGVGLLVYFKKRNTRNLPKASKN